MTFCLSILNFNSDSCIWHLSCNYVCLYCYVFERATAAVLLHTMKMKQELSVSGADVQQKIAT